jgi:putative endonuclease
MATPDRISLGKLAEDMACRELRHRGYEILARRHRTRLGEIDIIARDGPTIVFIEVKARTSDRYGGPWEAVTRQKRDRIGRLASEYLANRRWHDRPCRFDVVAVRFDARGRAAVEVVAGAFDFARA